MKVEEFLSYIKEAKSKATHKNYKKGLIEMFKQRELARTPKEQKEFIRSYMKRTKTIDLEEYIRTLGKQALDKEREEYKKLIEENNNNNH